MSMTPQFALCLFLTFAPAPPQSQVARDTPPPIIENARRERELRAIIDAGQGTKQTYIDLATLLHKQGRMSDAVEVARSAAAAAPSDVEASHRVAVFVWEILQAR